MSKLGSLLVREGLLTESDRRMIRRESGNYRGSFAKSVLALGLVDEDELAALFASKTAFKIAAKDLASEVQGSAVGAVPASILRWFDVIPIKKVRDVLHVAMVDPTDREVISQLEFFSGMHIRPVIAPFSVIRQAIDRHVLGKLDLKQSEFEDFLGNHSAPASHVAQRQKGAFGVVDLSSEPVSWGADDGGEESVEAGRNEMFELLTDDAEPVALAPVELVSDAPDDFSDAQGGAEAADDDLVDDTVATASMVADVFPDSEGTGASEDDGTALELAKDGGQENLDLDMDLSGLEGDIDFDLEAPDETKPAKSVAPKPAQTATASAELTTDLSLKSAPDEDLGLGEPASLPLEESAPSGADSGLDMGLDSDSSFAVDLNEPDALDEITAAAPSVESSLEISPDGSAEASGLTDDLDLTALSAPNDNIDGDVPSAEEDVVDDLQLSALETNSAVAETLDLNVGDAPNETFDLDLGESPSPSASKTETDNLALDSVEQDLLSEDENLELSPPSDSTVVPTNETEVPTNKVESISLDDGLDLPASDLSMDLQDGYTSIEDELDVSAKPSEPEIPFDQLDLSIPEEPTLGEMAPASFAANEADPAFDIDIAESSIEHTPDVAATSAEVTPTLPAEPLANVSFQAHDGVATLNRALVNLSLLMDSKKALGRLAEAADQVGVVSGAVLKLRGDSLSPGILWNREGKQLGTIHDVPAGLSGETLSKVVGPLAATEKWVKIAEVLKADAGRLAAAWPATGSEPTHIFAKKQGDSYTVGLGRFTASADHDGLRDSFGELVKAVGPKIT